MSCVTGPSKQMCTGARRRGPVGVQDDRARLTGALIVSSLTQCLVQLCHLWMVPACRLGLMATGGWKEEKRNKGIRSF